MQEKDNIAELFKEAFSNYEEPVRPELWTKISSSINTNLPGADPISVTTNAVSAGTGIMGKAAIWITGAIITVASITSVYYLTTNDVSTPTGSEVSVEPSEQVINEIPKEAVREEEKSGVSAPENNDELSSKVSETSPLQATNGAVNSESNSSTSVNTIQSPIVPADKNLTSIQINEPAAATDQTVQQKQPETVPPNISTLGNQINVPDAKVRAYPTSGIAPLTVEFSYDGLAQKTEWIFDDGTIKAQSNIIQHTFEKPGKYNVVLKFYDNQGQLKTLNQSIEVQANLHLKYIPNIFTPNNDGINDIFAFETLNVSEMEVAIYDKSGKFVYKWTGLESGWDGKLNSGHPAPEGTYFYIIFATGENQEKHQQKGTITLKR